ncbi:MAG: cytochrome c peroxidase [Siphonobacter sp.]
MKAIFFLFAGLFFLNLSYTNGEEPLNKVAVGEKLFFDPILSEDRTVSCASCHKPEFAFADTVSFSLGVHHQSGKRNTPSAMNLAGRLQLFWDGRASSLEMQALEPIANPNEMNLPIAEAVSRLQKDPFYTKAFRKLYKSDLTAIQLAEVIAAYERTLETSNSPYDRYINGDDGAMSEAAKRGRTLFIGKANCANCHSGEDFTADRFKNIGLFNGTTLTDQGRYGIVKDSTYLGHFKVPGLRNVALTAPYMHNGMFKTLRQVIEYYNHPDQIVQNGYNRDPSLNTPLALSQTEMNDLEAFLVALTDDQFTKK